MPDELDFNKLPAPMQAYIDELRGTLRKVKAESREIAAERDRLKALVEEKQRDESKPPDVRTMSRKDYRKYKADTLRALRRER